MSTLWNKIKLILKGRTIAASLSNLKSKWREPSFWIALLGNIASALATYKGLVPAEYAPALIVGNSIVTSAFNYMRGWQKAAGTDGVHPFSTSSETLLGLATMANNALIDMHTGGIATPWLAGTSIFLGHAIAAGRDLANMEGNELVSAGAAEPKDVLAK